MGLTKSINNDMLSKKITDAVCSVIEEKTGHKVKTIPMLQNNRIPAMGIMLGDGSPTPIFCMEDVHQQLRKRKIKPTVHRALCLCNVEEIKKDINAPDYDFGFSDISKTLRGFLMGRSM